MFLVEASYKDLSSIHLDLWRVVSQVHKQLFDKVVQVFLDDAWAGPYNLV
jgi:hypothetical protein